MPRKAVHDAFERALLGHTTGMTDLMDAPSAKLLGHHQTVFHTEKDVVMLAMLNGGDVAENVIAGILHLAMDNIMKEFKPSMENKNVKQRSKSGRSGRYRQSIAKL